ncbi:MAG: SRPBCC domain-containing protein [Ferruginibacter sp.]
MENKNYSSSFLVDQAPETVFNAINNVRGWWSEAIEGSTDKPGAVFNYHYKDVHICKMKIIDFIPGQKIVWLVMENYFNFTRDKTEWKDTKISFEISKKGDKTQLIFTHFGLVPANECYDICSDAWGNYITGSLKSLIETGKGKPNPYEPAIQNAAALEKENKQ